MVASAVLLSACGTHPGERALTGGVLGAATGAGVVAVAGGPVVVGSVVGGAAGAMVGAVTPPRRVYLGPSPWSRGRR